MNKNLNFVRPRQADLLNFFADSVLLNLNCHHLATIVSFNSQLQTAVATIDYPKVVPQLNEGTGVVTPVPVSYPPLVDCPVYFEHGQAGGFTRPVKKGDKCMAAFNDRDMDLWFTGVFGSAPNTGRLHAFSDAMLFVGMNPSTSPIANFDNTRPMIRDASGNTIIALSPDGTKINLQNASQNVATLIQNLINELKSMTIVVTGGSGVVSPADQAALASIASEFQQVIE